MYQNCQLQVVGKKALFSFKKKKKMDMIYENSKVMFVSLAKNVQSRSFPHEIRCGMNLCIEWSLPMTLRVLFKKVKCVNTHIHNVKKKAERVVSSH